MLRSRTRIALLTVLIALPAGLAGCPKPMQIAYPIQLQQNTFGFSPKWANKYVAYVVVLTEGAADTSGKPVFPGLLGECSSIDVENVKNFDTFATIWAIRATKPISAADLQLRPGRVPEGFEQIIPNPSESFNPTEGHEYYIMACLQPADDKFLSMGVRWVPSSADAPPVPIKTLATKDPFKHRPSGMLFPETIGSFQRRSVSQYDPAGNDISVNYNHLAFPPVIADIYVYPAPQPQNGNALREALLPIHFEKIKQVILNQHPGSRLINEEDVSYQMGVKTYPGKKAVFEYEGKFADIKQSLRSYLYVFSPVAEKWLIKYRITHPVYAEASAKIREFLDNIEWTIKTP